MKPRIIIMSVWNRRCISSDRRKIWLSPGISTWSTKTRRRWLRRTVIEPRSTLGVVWRRCAGRGRWFPRRRGSSGRTCRHWTCSRARCAAPRTRDASAMRTIRRNRPSEPRLARYSPSPTQQISITIGNRLIIWTSIVSFKWTLYLNYTTVGA